MERKMINIGTGAYKFLVDLNMVYAADFDAVENEITLYFQKYKKTITYLSPNEYQEFKDVIIDVLEGE